MSSLYIFFVIIIDIIYCVDTGAETSRVCRDVWNNPRSPGLHLGWFDRSLGGIGSEL